MFQGMAFMVGDYLAKHKDEFPYNKFPSMESLMVLEKQIMGLMTQIGLGDIVFCHNDTNQKNIIWNPHNHTMSRFFNLSISAK